MKTSPAEIVREYGPFPGVEHVHGVTFDGRYVWFACGDKLHALDPESGAVVGAIAPGGSGDNSGLAWAEGALWVGQHRGRKIHQVDPETGVVLRTIDSDRLVTGVTWVEGEIWHATWEGGRSDLRRVDPQTGQVVERLEMPPGVSVSGLEADGGERFFCGGGGSGKIRAVRRMGRAAQPSRTGREVRTSRP